MVLKKWIVELLADNKKENYIFNTEEDFKQFMNNSLDIFYGELIAYTVNVEEIEKIIKEIKDNNLDFILDEKFRF